ncbi:Serine/threonine-protein kinase PAK 2 [Beauveria bassiana]|nr:Serine/threonine-protein kinase PAK 2 [Beauveria bassiana]
MEGTDGDVIARLYFQARDMKLQNALQEHPLVIGPAALYDASYDSQRDATKDSTKDSTKDWQKDSQKDSDKDMQQGTQGSVMSSHDIHSGYIGYDEFENLPSLILRFSTKRNSNMGFVIGRNALCDLALNHACLAQFHGAFTFDSSHRLVFKDLRSRHGTRVKYDERDDDKSAVRDCSGKTCSTGFAGLIRRGFTWIVGGPGVHHKVEVRLGETLLMQVVIPDRDWSSENHKASVGSFLCNDLAVDSDRFQSAFMRAQKPKGRAKKHHILPSTPIYIHRAVGWGAFGTTFCRRNASTGKEIAVKQPRGGSIDDTTLNIKGIWANEIKILKTLKHPHITEFLGPDNPPLNAWPTIHLEYAALGCLKKEMCRKEFEPAEYISIVHQCLLALEYLHDEHQIAHRDIKPENILVFSRDDESRSILVKLADFGTSKISMANYTTICGTKLYWAPEMFKSEKLKMMGERQGYGKEVDIWSLGVVAFQMVLVSQGKSLPASAGYNSLYWEAVLALLEEFTSDGPDYWIDLLRNNMLKEQGRSSAATCRSLVEAFQGSAPGDTRMQRVVTHGIVDSGPTRTPTPDFENGAQGARSHELWSVSPLSDGPPSQRASMTPLTPLYTLDADESSGADKGLPPKQLPPALLGPDVSMCSGTDGDSDIEMLPIPHWLDLKCRTV